MRLFFALPLPEDARAKLAALALELEKRAPDASVGWVPAANLHVTLRFLGDVEEGQLPALEEAGRGAAAGVPRCRVALEGVGTFGGREPRVIWVGLAEDASRAALFGLAADLERRVCALGFAPADHAFAAHLTLGRVRSERGPRRTGKVKAPGPGVLAGAVAASRFGPLEVPVDRFVLYESRLERSRRPDYVERASFVLSSCNG